MNLPEDDKKRIAEWIGQKCGNIRCYCCGNSKWEILPFATIQVGFNLHTTRFHYHDGFPLVGLVCINCGHLIQFSTGIMGFRPDEPQQEQIPEGQV